MTVLGGGGALGVAACDAAEANGMFLPPLSGSTYHAVYEALRKPGSSAANPIDVANPFVPPMILKTVLLEAAKDERVDIQIQVTLLYHYKAITKRLSLPSMRDVAPLSEFGDAVQEALEKTGKPVVLVLPSCRQGVDDIDLENLMRHARQAFIARGIPVFTTLQDALRAIRRVSDYHTRRNNHCRTDGKAQPIGNRNMQFVMDLFLDMVGTFPYTRRQNRGVHFILRQYIP
jgi:acyl-CoA synthetase (NDP forming)